MSLDVTVYEITDPDFDALNNFGDERDWENSVQIYNLGSSPTARITSPTAASRSKAAASGSASGFDRG